MSVIAGQKPVRTKAKKSVANFKVREGMETGLKVTLRGQRMYEFLDRLISTHPGIAPRFANAVVEGKVAAVVAEPSPILRSLAGDLPALSGYVATTRKDRAVTALETEGGHPLLAQWQYGLGRSVAWTSDSTGRWAKNWVGWNGFSRFFSQLVGWTFPGEESGGIEASFETLGGRTRLHVQSVESDGSPRDFYRTMAVVVGPDLAPHEVSLDQVAPGVYESDLGEIESGAYAVRISQTRPGAAALGRTVGLVEPVAAEYRLLGVNLPFLAALRAATGGREIALPADPWRHDLKTTSSFTELWPWLLVLALLLWPLDIALRRVSIGRRELADARAAVGRRWRSRRAAAPRTAAAEGMLAARERAAGGAARAALLRGPEPALAPQAESSSASASESPERLQRPAAADAVRPIVAPSESIPPGAPEPPKLEEMDTLARLREAKRRARGG